MYDYNKSYENNMKNKKLVLVIIVFLLTNILGWINPSLAYDSVTEKSFKFEITKEDLISDDYYLNNNVLRSRLMVANLAEIDENYSNKFYYNQLTSQISKDVYDGISQNINTTTINIPVDLHYDVEATDEETLQAIYNEEIKPYIYDAFCAFFLDNPEFYWVQQDNIDGEITAEVPDDGTLELTITEIKLQVTEFSESENKEQFNTKLSEVANSISGDNFYDIAKGIHDYICQNVQNKTSEVSGIDKTAYGALINNSANSEGQSNLFILLCREKGINAVLIKGKVSNNDAQWVAVYQPDEQKWYAVDVTLDNGDEDTYDYFLVGNNKEINGEKFSVSHIANVIIYAEQATTFKAPALSNFTYGEFGVDIEYSNTSLTKDNVIVTITGNRELKELEGWTLSSDKMSIQKTYTENAKETITITSVNDETVEQEILIENIDKTPPSVQVKYSTTEPTTENVIVNIVSDEELQELEGWIISDDGKTLTKEYSENITETIVVYDLASNSTEVNISINNISKEVFECTVEYSKTEPTNEDVTVTITADRELKQLEGWELSSDSKKLSKVYTENVDEEIIIEDVDGNTTNVIVNIQNIDREKPNLKVSYSIVENTNQNVIVTIESDEPLKQPEGWAISSDKCTISKTYFNNASENVLVEDLAGNQVEQEIEINNIDKEPPEIDVDYQISNSKVIVTIKSSEPLKQLEGWTISEDKMQLTRVYTENLVEVLNVEDLVGNVTEVSIEITTIEEDNNNNNNNSQNGQITDNTMSNTSLPKAGIVSIVVVLIAMIIISIILYLKYRQYDEFTKLSK